MAKELKFGAKNALLSLPLLSVLTLHAAAQAPPGEGPPEGGMGGARGVRGTVTAISGTTLTIKTDEGDLYQVLTSTNSRIVKNRQPAKLTDIHIGDGLMAGGDMDAKAKTVGAVFVAVIDAEQAKKMREDLGKTWTAGEVTAIKDLTITIKRVDNVPQTFSVDENTSFKKRRDSITLADIQVGDRLTAQGVVKDGAFVASSVNIGRAGAPGGESRGFGSGRGNGSGNGAAPGTTPPPNQ